MQYAAVVEVDNSEEDADLGRKGLRDELAPALKSMPGFVSTVLLTAYERGRGLAVIVFETRDQAEQLARGFAIGQQIREGVVVTATDVLEVSASA